MGADERDGLSYFADSFSADDEAFAVFVEHGAGYFNELVALSDEVTTQRNATSSATGANFGSDLFPGLIELVQGNTRFVLQRYVDLVGTDGLTSLNLSAEALDAAGLGAIDLRDAAESNLSPEEQAAVRINEVIGIAIGDDKVSFGEIGDRIDDNRDEIIAFYLDQGQTEEQAAASFNDLLGSLDYLEDNEAALHRFDGGNDRDSKPGDPDHDGDFTARDAEVWALDLLLQSESPTASDFRIDIWEAMIERNGPIPLDAVPPEDQIGVAEIILDLSIDTVNGSEFGSGEHGRGVSTLEELTDQVFEIGGDLQSHMAERFVEEGMAAEVSVGFADDSVSYAEQGMATTLVSTGLLLMTDEERVALVDRLAGETVSLGPHEHPPALSVLVDALDLDGDELNTGALNTPYHFQVAAADGLLAAAINGDGTLGPGGTLLFDRISSQMMEKDADFSNYNGPDLQRFPGSGSAFDIRATLISAGGAPNYGMTAAEYEAALELEQVLSSPSGATLEGQARIDAILADLPDDATRELVLGLIMAGVPPAEAFRMADSAGSEYKTDRRVDVLRFLLPTNHLGDPDIPLDENGQPDLEAFARQGFPVDATLSLAAETSVLQGIQLQRFTENGPQGDSPLTPDQIALIGDLEGQLDLLETASWELSVLRRHGSESWETVPDANIYQTLFAIQSGELTEIDGEPIPLSLQRLADDLINPENQAVWATLYAAEGDEWFGADGQFDTGDFDIETLATDPWASDFDSDVFQKLQVQLYLWQQLGPIAPLLVNSDGKVTEDSINDWLDEHRDEIPPVVADRIRFGGSVGLGEDTFGWDEIAGIAGVIGLVVAGVVFFVPSAGQSSWVTAGLIGLAGFEGYAAYQAGDGLGATLAFAGGFADVFTAARFLARGTDSVSTLSHADELFTVLTISKHPEVWSELDPGEVQRLHNSMVDIAARSDIPALQRLAQQSGDMSPEQWAAEFNAIAGANQADLVRVLDDAGWSPAEIALARQQFGAEASLPPEFISLDDFAARFGDQFPDQALLESAHNQYRMAAASEEIVLGRLPDTLAARELGLPMLYADPWSLAVNDAYIQGAIDANRTIYLGSNPGGRSFYNLPGARFPVTVFKREYEQLINAGYVQYGDYLYPPGVIPPGPVVPSPGGIVSSPGNQAADFTSIVDDSDVPARFTSDERWGDLAGVDPATDQRSAGNIREGMTGLEAEAQGILPGPIERDPTGSVEFFDANGGRWDVKTMPGPFFNQDSFGNSIVKQLRDPDSMILIDTTYAGTDEVAALDEWIANNLTEAEIDRLRFVKIELG